MKSVTLPARGDAEGPEERRAKLEIERYLRAIPSDSLTLNMQQAFASHAFGTVIWLAREIDRRKQFVQDSVERGL